jgi:cytochrome c oxidase assembly factor CtaG
MKKDSPWLYPLLALIVLAPGYFVWAQFPDIVSKKAEVREQQIIGICVIAALPLIFTLLSILCQSRRSV